MGHKVILSTLALEDLEQIVAYVAKSDPAAAEGLGMGCSTRPKPSVICLTAAVMCGSGRCEEAGITALLNLRSRQ
jgi:hypothetical protein